MGSQPETARNYRIIRAILVVVLVLVAAYFGARAGGWLGGGEGGSLRLYGNVEIREVQLGFRVPGRIAQILVDEGDRVQPGEVLARLDTRPLKDKLANADARLAAASAEVRRDSNGSRPQQISEAQAAVAAAEAALTESRRQLDRRQALIDKGFISRADLQTAQANADAAAARLNAARANLSLAQEGVRAEDRAANQAQRQAVLADLQAAQTDLSDTELRAPEAGQVLTRAQEAGAIVETGQTVLTLALTQPVRVRAYVAEPDLPRVRPGMRVEVSADGTGKRWPATIGFISAVAEFTPKTVQTEQLRTDLVYRLRLVVDDPSGELRQGQPVTVIVPAAERR